MTHFIGAVLVPAAVTPHVNQHKTQFPDLYGADAKEWVPGTELNEFLDAALERFSEHREVEIWQPKEQLIEKARKDIEKFRDGTYAEWLEKGEEAYRADYGMANSRHFEYLKTEFPAKLEWTDEEVYQNEVLKWEDDENIRESDGAIRTTYNPHSKWDWWTIGGRWEKMYAEKQLHKVRDLRQELVDTLANMNDPEAKAELAAVEAEIAFTQAEAKEKRATWDDIDKARAKLLDCKAYLPWWFPYSLVVKDTEVAVDETTNVMTGYEWHTQGRMGWFGMSTKDMTPQQWVERLIEILETQDDDDYLVYVDFHI